jgi:hypothetical protein
MVEQCQFLTVPLLVVSFFYRASSVNVNMEESSTNKVYTDNIDGKASLIVTTGNIH